MKALLIVVVTVSFISSGVFARPSPILSLKENTGLPQAFLSDYTVNDIAFSLVQRRHLNHEKNSSGMLDYSRDSEIFISFNSSNTASILKAEEFFNAHMGVQSSTFHDDLKIRADLEDAMLGINLGHEQKSNRIRPKYAYLQINMAEIHPKTTFNPNYGNVFAKVKDEVKSRSTFTLGDSMDEGKDTIHTFLYRDKVVPRYSKIPYWEAQIWGNLKLTDIDYFLVNCPGFPKTAKAHVELMLAKKQKIFFCKLDENRRNISQGKEVVRSDLKTGVFMEIEDKMPPLIKNVAHKITAEGKISLQIDIEDNQGINFCLVKAFHKSVLLLDDEISITDVGTKSKNCNFLIPKSLKPVTIKIFVKDWFNNQTMLEKTIN